MSNTIYFYYPSKKYGIFSQWYMSPFTDSDNNNYKNCEQYMMYKKAILFKDYNIAKQIINCDGSPKTVKMLGRKVNGFIDEIWFKHRYQIVLDGNILKFQSNSNFISILLQTKNNLLVEAAHNDRIWGIGFAENYAEKHRNDWGENLLGKILMEIRSKYQNLI